MSENVAVPLSAATTRYGSSPSCRTTSFGRHDLAVRRDIVGDVEQSGDEHFVGGDALGLDLRRAWRSFGICFGTKPPLEPTGTMTAFFTCCALTRPRTSVRKSCGRSDQRMPPRATLPKRRCTPSTRGE